MSSWTEIIERLERERQASGKSMGAVAAATGLSESTIWTWNKIARRERERTEPEALGEKNPVTGPGIAAVSRALAVFGLELSVRSRRPRLLTWEEVTGRPVGFGWLETDVTDEGDEEPCRTFEACCWSWQADRLPRPLHVVGVEMGELLRAGREEYNRAGGFRIWSGPARAAVRRETKWEST